MKWRIIPNRSRLIHVISSVLPVFQVFSGKMKIVHQEMQYSFG
jgi:hypothetical protein